MRSSLRSLLAPLALLAASLFTPGSAGAADGDVGILVLKEHGVGSAAQAQPYVDKLVAIAAKQSGWSGAKGSYQTTRTGAEKYITDSKPHYGIFSLAAFLGMKDKQKLEIIPTVACANVELVFDPPWDQSMMTEAARLQTGMF